jgi:L-iditol 2-dehydrogenase
MSDGSMLVARIHGVRDVRVSREPVPVPAADESLVRVEAVGICGSDIHWWTNAGIGDARVGSPLVLGHEAAGTVVSGPLAGSRVAIEPGIACGACERCAEGNVNLCPFVRHAGHGVTDGALREYMAWPTKDLYVVPSRMTAVETALAEPLAVALHGLHLGRVGPGTTVAVLGCGPIGLLAIAAATAAGATVVVATDPLGHRLALAPGFGAQRTVLVTDGPARGTAWAATGGRGVDVAFEASGDPGAVEDAMAVVRAGGTVVLEGIPDDDRTSFTASVARRKGLTIRIARRIRGTFPRAIDLIASGAVDVHGLATATYALAEAEAAFRAAEARAGAKVIIEPAAER